MNTCVCACVRERERERACVRRRMGVCMYVCMYACMPSSGGEVEDVFRDYGSGVRGEGSG